MSPSVRPDLTALSGYHSPEVDVDVRLNTNESPYPPPARLVADLAAAIPQIVFNRYPDRHAFELRKCLGELVGVPAEAVFVGKGSNELFQILLLAFGGPSRRALVFAPTYSMHSQIARITATQLVSVPRPETDFVVRPDLVRHAVADCDPDVVFFCNPNNPTGTPEMTESILVAAERSDRLVIVDEAYVEFGGESMLRLALETDNVVVCRTLSKAWSMPALRLGYMIAAPELIAKLEAAHLPYHVDSFAQLAGRLAIGESEAMIERAQSIVRDRTRLIERLGRMDNIKTWSSAANFVLMRPPLPAASVWNGLVDRGVLVRDVSTWQGTTGCLRVSIGTPAENDRFIEALDEVLAESH